MPNQTEPIPGYRLLERLGRGGFGEVWKAEAPGGLLKAIKFVFGDLEGGAGDNRTAEQELKALNRVKTIRHPYILSLERVDVVEGQLLIVMELADRNLWDRFRECQDQGLPGIPRDELLGYMEESAEALDLMNNQYKLQHLDIKPQNIFLVHNHVKVADFGLAKDFAGDRATVTGGVTPVYAAPETFDGTVTRFCDQYSLAIVYQELLCGQRPFNGSNSRQLLMQHIHGVPDLSPLPETDRGPIARALAKKPDDRFPTCTDLIQALRLSRGAAPGFGAAAPKPAVVPQTPAPASPRTPSLRGRGVPRPEPSPPPALVQTPAQTQTPPEGGPQSLVIRTQSPPAAAPLTEGPMSVLRTQQRPGFLNSAQFSALRTAPPEVTGDGVLLPALVIGVGGVGQYVLRQLRKALIERFGSLDALPHLRFLAIDTEPVTAPPGGEDASAALTPQESLHVPLFRASHYMKPRDGLPPADLWLSPQLLYRIPRNPSTTGVRGFGRLAFADNYRAIAPRLRVELESLLEEEALGDAERCTRLRLRTNRPRAYVVTGLGGGTGSGMFLDLAYLLRHQLYRLGFAEPDVQAVLLLPPAGGFAGRAALGNTFAALTELHHYSEPDTVYEARFDLRDSVARDPERPFRRSWLVPVAPPGDEPALRTAGGLAGGFLFRELLTPLGRAGDERRGADRTAFRTFGAYRLAWPRRALLGRAARHLAERLLRVWVAGDTEPLRVAVGRWLAGEWRDRGLEPEALAARLRAAAEKALGQPVEEAFDAVTGPPPAPSAVARIDPAAAYVALDRLTQWVGQPGGTPGDANSGRLRGSLEPVARALAEECRGHLASLASHFLGQPGHRTAAAEEALRQIAAQLETTLQGCEGLFADAARRAAETYLRLAQLIGNLKSFGLARKSAAAQELVDTLRLFPRLRLEALLVEAVVTVLRSLLDHTPDYLREVAYCRERLADLPARLPAGEGGSVAALGPGRVIIASGSQTLDDAAQELAYDLSPEELEAFDQAAGDHIRAQFGALASACGEGGDRQALCALLVRQARAFLEDRLGKTDSASMFLAAYPEEEEAQGEVELAFEAAAPATGAPTPAVRELRLLGVPAGPSGERFRELAGRALPGVEFVAAPGGDEVVFVREAALADLADLPQLGPQAHEAYRQDPTAAHSRRDVAWRPAARADAGPTSDPKSKDSRMSKSG
jgi:serine/threonine protein kinase